MKTVQIFDTSLIISVKLLKILFLWRGWKTGAHLWLTKVMFVWIKKQHAKYFFSVFTFHTYSLFIVWNTVVKSAYRYAPLAIENIIQHLTKTTTAAKKNSNKFMYKFDLEKNPRIKRDKLILSFSVKPFVCHGNVCIISAAQTLWKQLNPKI